MSTTKDHTTLEDALAGFQPDEQAQLRQDFVSYLQRIRTLRDELNKGEADIHRGAVGSLADLDEAIAILRRQYAG